MCDTELRTIILLNLQAAMLGEIFTGIRSVTCSWAPLSVNIRVIVDGIIDDDD